MAESNIGFEEKYVTYRVYKVLENDNLDTILTKYSITKEELSEYNDIENIKSGDKSENGRTKRSL